MEFIGTKYGGWWIPKNMKLNENSIIYSGGIGEDMSFDLRMQHLFNCNVICIDPTKRAVKHFEELKEYYNTKEWKFSGDIQKDYKEQIDSLNPDFSKIKYLSIGLWDKKDTLKFYKQNNETYVSQSLIDGMFSNNYEQIEVDTIDNIMKSLNHTHIEILKIDIEGAEVKVLKDLFSKQIFPKLLLVEFDLFIQKKDTNETKQIIEWMLRNGYTILKNDMMNITFQYNK